MSEHVWRKPRIVEIKVGSMADHALQYRGRGWAPLPLPPKGKAPTFAGWQSFVAEDSTEFNGNMGLLLGVLSGGLVDTDLDCKEAVALAPDMLPPTGAIFGRESKLRSHWLYVCDPPPETRQFQTKDGMVVELRSTGAQTMVPPSVHPSGEPVEWSSAGEPARIDGAELLRAIGDLAGMSLLVRHWPAETARYNAEGALAGALLRAGRSVEQVEHLLTVLQKHAGAAPRHPPGKTAARLDRRLADGKPTPGLRRLKVLIGAEVVEKVAEWMRLSPFGAVYEERDGAIVWNTTKMVKGVAIPISIALNNFTCAITEVVRRDDGSGDVERSFKLAGSCGDAEVPAEEFDSMGWVTPAWGPWGSIKPGRDLKPHLAEAIKVLSEPEERTIYTHLGWRLIEGRWFYLHAGGAIGSDGPVEGIKVELAGELEHYRLPAVRDLKAAVSASLSMRALGDAGLLMLAAVYRAPLVEFCQVTTSVFVEGATGAFKSAIQGVALSHWGARWDGVRFPANWTATANALERMASDAKDALFVVDDFKPSSEPGQTEKLHHVADRFLRGAANLGGRDRMNADTSLRKSYHARGLVMSSGEDIPKGFSLRARMVIHRAEKEDTDTAELTRLQGLGARGIMAEAMAGYVQWLAGRDIEKLREGLASRAIELRGEASGDHPRTPDNIASLLLGMECLAQFARECEAIDEADDLVAQARDALGRRAGAQDAEQAAEDPARRFMCLIGEALAARRVHLADRDGNAPPGVEAICGWRKRQYHDINATEHTAWEAQGDRIGWIEGDYVWLRRALAFAAAERLSREQNRSLGVTLDTLGKRLAEAGLIEEARPGPVRAEGDVVKAYRIAAAEMVQLETLTLGGAVESLRAAAVAAEWRLADERTKIDAGRRSKAKQAVAEVLKLIDETIGPAVATETEDDVPC